VAGVRPQDLRGHREAVGFDALAERFLDHHSVDELAELAEVPREHLEELLHGSAASPAFDVTALFALCRSMELLMAEGIVGQLEHVKRYLAEWFPTAVQAAADDEGVLEEKDIEQLLTLHRFIDRRLTRLVEHLADRA
jgi:hypothetical protein